MTDQITLPEAGSKMELALNQALGDFRMAAARQRFSGRNGMDTKRQNAWQAFGWNPNPNFMDFYRLWERGGLAHGAVSRMVSKCWQDNPEIIQGDEDAKDRERTQWEKGFAKFAKTYKLWDHVEEADKRRLVGHYSALILQIADGKLWSDPVTGRAARRLVKIIPAWEGQLYPTEYDTDEKSENYGEPTMFTYNEGAMGISNSSAVATFAGRMVQIHPSRVIILGDITQGIPLLRAGYNDFASLEKILGGSGESFLKNAARQLAVEFDKDVDLDDIANMNGVPVSDLRKIYDDVTRGLNQGIDQTIVTQAAKVNPLVANVPDPEKHFEASVMSAAASIMIPVMVWIGSQTGERASREDQKDGANTCQGRRVRTLTGDMETIVNRLILLRLLDPVEDFTVVWSNLGEANQSEKLANGKIMQEINNGAQATGELVYSHDEIRTMTGHTNKAREVQKLPDIGADADKEKPE